MSLHRKRARTPLTALCIPQRLYLVPRLCLWLLPCLLVLLPQPSLADTITFYDLSDTMTVSVTDPSREIASVDGSSDLPFEFASVTVGPPEPGATVEGLEIVLYFTEPGPAIGCCVPLSDQIDISSPGQWPSLLFLVSMTGLLFSRIVAGTPASRRRVEYSRGDSLTWSDGTVDGIYFRLCAGIRRAG